MSLMYGTPRLLANLLFPSFTTVTSHSMSNLLTFLHALAIRLWNRKMRTSISQENDHSTWLSVAQIAVVIVWTRPVIRTESARWQPYQKTRCWELVSREEPCNRSLYVLELSPSHCSTRSLRFRPFPEYDFSVYCIASRQTTCSDSCV